MEFTDEYVYLNLDEATSAAAPRRDAYTLVIKQNNDRVPYALVEVMSLSVKSGTNTSNHFTLKVQEIGQNYRGEDNVGTALAIAPFNSSIAAGHFVYTMINSPTKIMFSNPRTLTFYLEDELGERRDIGDAYNIDSYTLLLKVSYPKVGEVPVAYRTQIPL